MYHISNIQCSPPSKTLEYYTTTTQEVINKEQKGKKYDENE